MPGPVRRATQVYERCASAPPTGVRCAQRASQQRTGHASGDSAACKHRDGEAALPSSLESGGRDRRHPRCEAPKREQRRVCLFRRTNRSTVIRIVLCTLIRPGGDTRWRAAGAQGGRDKSRARSLAAVEPVSARRLACGRGGGGQRSGHASKQEPVSVCNMITFSAAVERRAATCSTLAVELHRKNGSNVSAASRRRCHCRRCNPKTHRRTNSICIGSACAPRSAHLRARPHLVSLRRARQAARRAAKE